MKKKKKFNRTQDLNWNIAIYILKVYKYFNTAKMKKNIILAVNDNIAC